MLDEMGGQGVEDYEEMARQRKAEYQVVDLMTTGLGQMCRSMVLQCCQNYHLSTFWPPRAVATACVLLVTERNGIDIHMGRGEWIETIAGKKKVDPADVEEIFEELKKLMPSTDVIHED
jgi:hypothetical protein